MANDFSGDANCKALWRFENGALTTDSKGGNTLTAVNTPVADLADFKEGLASVDLELTDQDYFYIDDTNLDAGFPLKNGDANKKISVCFWIKYESLHATQWDVPYGKMAQNKRSFAIARSATADDFVFALGYNAGASWEFEYHGTTIVTGRWYHVGFTYQDSDKSYKMRIWDDTAGALLGGAEVTGNTANNINVEDARVQIGAGLFAAAQEWVDGLIDEVVVFDDILTSDEIDSIRSGTFGPITTLTLAGTIAATSSLSGAIRKRDLSNFPEDRPSGYDPDLVWDEVTQAWVSTAALLEQGGSRYRSQLVVVGKDLVYYSERE